MVTDSLGYLSARPPRPGIWRCGQASWRTRTRRGRQPADRHTPSATRPAWRPARPSWPRSKPRAAWTSSPASRHGKRPWAGPRQPIWRPTLPDGKGLGSHIRFWEQNGSGGGSAGAVRSAQHARPDGADVQEHRNTGPLPSGALSSHRSALAEGSGLLRRPLRDSGLAGSGLRGLLLAFPGCEVVA
jgi:hypothetical protein